jgi:hypothetical protein
LCDELEIGGMSAEYIGELAAVATEKGSEAQSVVEIEVFQSTRM